MPRPTRGSSRPLIFRNSRVVLDQPTSFRSPATMTGPSTSTTLLATTSSSASRSVDSSFSVGLGGAGCRKCMRTDCPDFSSTIACIDGTSSCTRNCVAGSFSGNLEYTSMP